MYPSTVGAITAPPCPVPARPSQKRHVAHRTTQDNAVQRNTTQCSTVQVKARQGKAMTLRGRVPTSLRGRARRVKSHEKGLGMGLSPGRCGDDSLLCATHAMDLHCGSLAERQGGFEWGDSAIVVRLSQEPTTQGRTRTLPGRQHCQCGVYTTQCKVYHPIELFLHLYDCFDSKLFVDQPTKPPPVKTTQ